MVSDAEHERDEERGRDELPGRDAGGARHHELQAARQIQIAEHRRDQDRERQDAFGDEGHAIERDLGDQERRDILEIAGATQHLDEVDHRDHRERAREHGENRA